MSEPIWLSNARKYIGVREIVGPKHSPTIMGWIKKLALSHGKWIANILPNDETPWCGVFVAEVFDELKMKIPASFMSARKWAEWGKKLTVGAPGAVLVFVRAGGGHVGFYVRETPTHFIVLGGNQGNMVSETAILKSRCIAIRWPADTVIAPSSRVVGGRKTSVSNGNEA